MNELTASRMMKTTLLLLTVCVALVASTTTSSHHHKQHTTVPHTGGEIDHLIKQEVKLLLHQDPNLSVDNCSTKCDALFDLVAHRGERLTDRLCHYECQRLIAAHHHTHSHSHTHSTTPSQP